MKTLHTSFPSPLRLTALSLAIMAVFSGPSHAQAQDADGLPAATVVVSGQRASLRNAIAAQEKADNIISVISSDDIGGLPDKNAAEALARLPGVSVQRDQGEGRYITVRGLGPDLNAVTINGALTSLWENNLVAILAEAEYGYVNADIAAYVKLTDNA